MNLNNPYYHNSHQEQNLDEWSKMACNFEDIHQVSPLVMMAWDIGFDLTDKNYEQKCPESNQAFSVRVFKSHQRLSAMNPGKEIQIIRIKVISIHCYVLISPSHCLEMVDNVQQIGHIGLNNTS